MASNSIVVALGDKQRGRGGGGHAMFRAKRRFHWFLAKRNSAREQYGKSRLKRMAPSSLLKEEGKIRASGKRGKKAQCGIGGVPESAHHKDEGKRCKHSCSEAGKRKRTGGRLLRSGERICTDSVSV